MSAIHATYVEGNIVPDEPPKWPEGTRLVVEVALTVPVRMMTEEEQGDDPESVARWLAWYDSLQPLVITSNDGETIRKVREDQRKFETEQWEARSRKLEKLFE